MNIAKSKRAMRVAALLLGAVAMLWPSPAVRSQTAPVNSGSNKSYEIDVTGTKGWVDTKVDVRGGRSCASRPAGRSHPTDESYKGRSRTSGTFGPDGLPRGWADLIHQYAVTGAGHGALIGRIGSAGYVRAFLVGASKEYDVPTGGRLFLGINQGMSEASTADGSFHVKIEVLDEGSAVATTVGGPLETRVPGITPDLLSKIRAASPILTATLETW